MAGGKFEVSKSIELKTTRYVEYGSAADDD
jgi:hypothetical protein